MKLDKTTYDLCMKCRKESLARVLAQFGASAILKIGLKERILSEDASIVFSDYEKCVAEHELLMKKVTPAMRKRLAGGRPTPLDSKICNRLARLITRIESCKKRLDKIVPEPITPDLKLELP